MRKCECNHCRCRGTYSCDIRQRIFYNRSPGISHLLQRSLERGASFRVSAPIFARLFHLRTSYRIEIRADMFQLIRFSDTFANRSSTATYSLRMRRTLDWKINVCVEQQSNNCIGAALAILAKALLLEAQLGATKKNDAHSTNDRSIQYSSQLRSRVSRSPHHLLCRTSPPAVTRGKLSMFMGISRRKGIQ
jgi:hypothetical protein